MWITFKRANNRYKALPNKYSGVRYGSSHRAFRIKDKIVVYRNYMPVLWINKKDEYEFANTKNLLDIQFFNRYTPAKIKKKKKGLFCQFLPFYTGLRVNNKGDVLIPEAWPPPTQKFTCAECNDVYSNDMCNSCTQDFLEEERNRLERQLEDDDENLDRQENERW